MRLFSTTKTKGETWVYGVSDGILLAGNAVMAAGACVLTFIGLPGSMGITLGILMFFDFISGIAKCYVLERPITSRKLKAGVISKVLLLILPIAVALAAKAIGVDLLYMVVWVVNLLILGELYSFIANVYTVKTRKVLPEWSVLAIIARKVRSVAEALLAEGSSK